MHAELPVFCRFQQSNIIVLHDEQPHPEYWPTKVRLQPHLLLWKHSRHPHFQSRPFCHGICHAWRSRHHVPQLELPDLPVGISLKESVLQVNILDAVRWLVRDTQPQDSLVFAFSGHGCLDVSEEQERDGILSSDYEQV